MVRNSIRRLVETARSKPSFENLFAATQAKALEQYRQAVSDHLDGKKIDLSPLLQIGPQLGIPATKVGATFAEDCETLQRYRDQARHVAALDRVARESAEAGKNASEEVDRLYRELQAAIQRRDAVAYDAQGKAFASQILHSLERENPRLWGRQSEVSEHLVSEEEAEVIEPELVPAAAVDDREAQWIDDD